MCIRDRIYGFKDIGVPKTTALERAIEYKLGHIPLGIEFHNQKVKSVDTGILFLLTDTMESRREIFGYSTNLLHIIETRMASTHGNIHSISPFNKADTVKWFATMMSDDTPTDSAELSPCGTAMTVGPTASIIANMAVWEFINYLLNQGTATKRADIFLKPLMIDTGEINHDQIKEAG